MSDIEISKALAMAIGWHRPMLTPRGLCVYTGHALDRVKTSSQWARGYRLFDYRDPAVIWPIAERYSAFPSSLVDGNFRKAKARNRAGVIGWEVIMCDYKNSTEYKAKWLRFQADTAAKAVALAVIGVQA